MLALDNRVKSEACLQGPMATFIFAFAPLVILAAIVTAPWYPSFLPKGIARSREGSIPSARPNEQVSIREIGPHDPRLSLVNGHDLVSSYQGPAKLQRALEQNEAQALSLVSADYDEDGVPDLVSGYAYDGHGIITVHRGNVDSIYPNAPEAKQGIADGTFTDAPFLSPARVFAAPVAADFIGAGDFDGDSHWDVVVASRTHNALYLLSGDGHGGFQPAKEIPLRGVVTAMTTGEINRADGLTDVVVGVTTERGAEALVFEGPEGALKAQAEV